MKKRLITNSFGFTLIELMAVIVIIIVVVGLLVSGASYVQKKGGISRTESEIATIEQAVENFKSDFGGYPYAVADLWNVLTNRNKNVTIAFSTTNITVVVTPTQAYMPDYPVNRWGQDPFGMLYNYRGPTTDKTQPNWNTFALWSNGPNRANNVGTGDDIINWK